jgi:hypothetical protein
LFEEERQREREERRGEMGDITFLSTVLLQ